MTDGPIDNQPEVVHYDDLFMSIDDVCGSGGALCSCFDLFSLPGKET